MNKFLAICTDKNDKLLGRFDSNNSKWLITYFRNMFPKQEIRIQIVLNRFICGKFKVINEQIVFVNHVKWIQCPCSFK